MKVSLEWLREFVNLPDSVPALCDLLTLAGVEVEGIETRGVTTDNVVVAQIRSSEPHPNADRLSVCQVDDGSGAARQIVCGAKNYAAGDKVPLALPGAVLPGDFKIKVGRLRGVESQGMLCSAKELGLAEDAEGLLILSPDAPVGTPMKELFPPETILEVEVTPNRPDLLSHIGMAREIAALARQPLAVPRVQPPGPESKGGVEIRLDAGEDCPLYVARKISGVTVGPSPVWLKRKLSAVGLRPINNIVDITNFVMLETGQPLHAFDAAKLSGGIRVRHAAEGETFAALDGRTYTLTARQMVIADGARPVAVAGVMGGEESGVTESTRELLLESAWFRPGSVRRTSRELGLSSDSSYRFERGVDPAGVEPASLRAARLVVDLAGGVVEARDVAGEEPESSARLVPLRPGRCAEVAGGVITDAEASAILERLGLVQKAEAWQVPGFRPDLTREIDLVEEVVRVFGIENIPSRMQGRYVSSSAVDALHDRCMELRRELAASGFFEARNVSLVSARAVAGEAEDDLRPIKNPLSEDQTILRPSLLPGLLAAVAHNIRGGERSVRLFEIGRVFRATGGEERLHLAMAITGPARPASWRDGTPPVSDFFDLKGVLASLGLPGLTFQSATRPGLPLAADLVADGKTIGVAGQLAPARARELDAPSPVLVAELELTAFPIATTAGRAFHELPRFPAVTRDIALLAPLTVAQAEIEHALRSANEPLLQRVELFDVFTDPSGSKVPADRKSLAYSLTYRTNERTLTTDEVTAAHARIKERLKAAVNVQFRE